MKVSALFFMTTRFSPLIFIHIYAFSMPTLHLMTQLQEISLLIDTLLFFTASDEVYKSSWFAYESLRFIMDKTKPRQTLKTVSNHNFHYQFSKMK
jgi:hypothetical protein